jgi:hypothetical protein
MVDYAESLEQKYSEIIIVVVKKNPRITIGQLIDKIFNSLKINDKCKREIRDAILLLTGLGKLRMEAISKKRIEVSLKSDVK